MLTGSVSPRMGQWVHFMGPPESVVSTHLLLNRVMPKGGTSDTVDGMSFLNSLREFNPKLMSPLVVPRARRR